MPNVAAEKARVGGDPAKVEVARVFALDTLELLPVGPNDGHLRSLAVSAKHNIDHAATADTINIAEARGGKMFTGNSATVARDRSPRPPCPARPRPSGRVLSRAGRRSSPSARACRRRGS